MRITIDITGLEAKIESTQMDVVPRGALAEVRSAIQEGPALVPPEVEARAAASGALSAGPAPVAEVLSESGVPGLMMPLSGELISAPITGDLAAGAAPGIPADTAAPETTEMGD